MIMMYGSTLLEQKKDNDKKRICNIVGSTLVISVLFFICFMLYTIHGPTPDKVKDSYQTATVSQRIYIGSYSTNISIIDVATSETFSFAAGDSPSFLEVNPVDPSTVYVVNELGADVHGIIFEMQLNINRDGDMYAMSVAEQTLPGYNPSSVHSSPNNERLAVAHFLNGGGLALYSLHPLKLTCFYKFGENSQLHDVKFIDDNLLLVTDFAMDKVYLMKVLHNYQLSLVSEYQFQYTSAATKQGPRSIAIPSLMSGVFLVSLQTQNGVALFSVTDNVITLDDVQYFDQCSAVSDVRVIGDIVGVGCRKCNLYHNNNGCIALLRLDVAHEWQEMSLTQLMFVDSDGERPRSFDFMAHEEEKNSLKIIIGNQDSHNVVIKTVDLLDEKHASTIVDDASYDIRAPAYILYL